MSFGAKQVGPHLMSIYDGAAPRAWSLKLTLV